MTAVEACSCMLMTTVTRSMCSAEEEDVHLDQCATAQLQSPSLQSRLPCNAPRAPQVTTPISYVTNLHTHTCYLNIDQAPTVEDTSCLQARGGHRWEACHMVCNGACGGNPGHLRQTCSKATCHTSVISHGNYAPAACEGCIAHFQLCSLQVPWQLVLALTAGVGPELQSAAKQAAELPASHARHACIGHC